MTLKLSGVQLGNLTGGPSSISLAELSDVSIVTPQTGQYLRYNDGTSEWENSYIDVDLSGSEGVTINRSGSTTTIGLGAITPTSIAATGTVSGSNLSGTNTGDQTITLTGDVTGSGTGSFATTLATVNVSPQTDQFRKITVDAKGLVTATSAVTTGDITALVDGAYVNITGDTMSGYLILNADPNTGLGAATKQYVDNIASGLTIHAACKAGTTANLTATYNNGASGVGATLTGTGALPTIDGVTLSVNDRLLVKNQSTTFQNGVYVVTQITSNWVLTRASDFDGAPSSEIQAGDAVFVQQGTTQDNTQWVQNTDGPITVGTTALIFVQFGGPGTYTAGTGINVAGTVISNTGVLSNIAGTGIGVSGATGNVTISNTGVTSLAGTAGNITSSASTGAVTLNLATAGSAVSNQFVKVTTDAYGRVTATSAVVAGDITSLVNSTYVQIAGDTMTGTLNSTMGEAIRLKNNGAYISGFDTGNTTRTGYLQFNPTSGYVKLQAEGTNDIVLVNAAGTIRLDASATVFSSTVPITAPVGSAATPSIRFTGDVDTGLYQASANTVGVSTGGSLAATFGSTGSLTVVDYIDAAIGINGGYGTTNGSGSNWGANIWAMGPSYDGSGSGATFTPSTYGLSWLRSGNAAYDSLVGEGVYLYQNSTFYTGVGTAGVYTTGKFYSSNSGSAATPSVQITSGNGLYISAANTLSVSTNGTLAATFSSAGALTTVGTLTTGGGITQQSGYFNLYPYNGTYDDGGYSRWFWNGNTGTLLFARQGGTGTAGIRLQATGFIGDLTGDVTGTASLNVVRSGDTMSGSLTFSGSAGVRGNASDTAAAPTFSWNGDADTGMYHSGTNTVGISTGGTVALTIGTTAATFASSIDPVMTATTPSDTYSMGFRNIPRSTSTTISRLYCGFCKSITTGVTIPSATFVGGDVFSIFNNSASAITITQGSGLTMYGYAGATGNRTLAARGMCTFWFESASVCKITGEIT